MREGRVCVCDVISGGTSFVSLDTQREAREVVGRRLACGHAMVVGGVSGASICTARQGKARYTL